MNALLGLFVVTIGMGLISCAALLWSVHLQVKGGGK